MPNIEAKTIREEITKNITENAKDVKKTIMGGFEWSGEKMAGLLDFSKSPIINGIKRGIEKIPEGFKKNFQMLSSTLSNVLGPEIMGVLEVVKNAVSGIFNFVSGIGKWIWALVLKFFGLFKRDRDKRAAREKKDDPKKSNVWLILSAVAMLVVGVVAGYFTQALGIFKPLSGLLKPFARGGFIYNLFSKLIPSNLQFVQRISTVFNNTLTKVGNVFRNIVAKISKSRFFGIGAVIGRALFWFRMIWQVFNELTDNTKSIRDKILGISASILGLVLELPQIIFNAVLSLFTDFRVDFSKEAIIDLANKITNAIQPIVFKVFDIFLVDIPNALKNAWNEIKRLSSEFANLFVDAFNNLKVFVYDKIVSPIINVVSWVKERLSQFDPLQRIRDVIEAVIEIPNNIFNFIRNVIPSWDDIKSKIMDKVPNWAKRFFSSDDSEVDISQEADSTKVMKSARKDDEIGELQRKSLEASIQKDQQMMLLLQKMNEELVGEMKTARKEQKENANSIKTTVVDASNRSINTTGGGENESPDEVENFGMVFMNKSTLGPSF